MNTRPMRKNLTSGFTLIELLVVVLMTGILASIAAPGWLAFINRQRVKTVQNEMREVLQSAQSDARRNNIDYEIDIDSTVGSPILTVKRSGAASGTDYDLGGGPIRDKIKIIASASSLEITHSGEVGDATAVIPFVMSISVEDIDTPTRCIIVTTLLGGLANASGDDCAPSTSSYAPEP